MQILDVVRDASQNHIQRLVLLELIGVVLQSHFVQKGGKSTVVVGGGRLDLDSLLSRFGIHNPYPSLGHIGEDCGPLAFGPQDHGWIF